MVCRRVLGLSSRCALHTACQLGMARVFRPGTLPSWWPAPGTALALEQVAVRPPRSSCTPVLVWRGWSQHVARSRVRVRMMGRKPVRNWKISRVERKFEFHYRKFIMIDYEEYRSVFTTSTSKFVVHFERCFLLKIYYYYVYTSFFIDFSHCLFRWTFSRVCTHGGDRWLYN